MSTGVAIAGAGEADEIGVLPHKSALQLHAEAAANALAHAGLALAEVDALFTCGLDFMPSLLVAEYLGIRPRYSSSNSIGGSSFVARPQPFSAERIATGTRSGWILPSA